MTLPGDLDKLLPVPRLGSRTWDKEVDDSILHVDLAKFNDLVTFTLSRTTW